jgi:parvulin-like peptidyl-prolyl isomerase
MIQKTPLISQDDILRYVKLSCQMPSAITSIVERRVVEAEAQAVGLKIDTTELQKAADSFRLKNNLVTTQETLSWLQRHALSIDDLETLVYDTVLSVKLAEHLFASQVETYFAERWLDYVQVVMYETVLDNSDLAMELFYALQEQEITFIDVVRHYNQDPELRRRGGYRGLVKRKDLTPELSAAVFSATPPQLLKPITKGKKTYLIWVEEVIQPILDDILRSQILSELFTSWLKQQVAQVDQTKILDPTLIPSITL